MRPIERIDNFLNKVNWSKLQERWNITFSTFLEGLIQIRSSINETELYKYWIENPDQRIGQVLINLGIVPDNTKIWNDEEAEILMSQGLPIEECVYWISHLDKDNKPLTKSVSRLLKDLDTDHILNIIIYCEENYKTLNMKICSYFFKRIYEE